MRKQRILRSERREVAWGRWLRHSMTKRGGIATEFSRGLMMPTNDARPLQICPSSRATFLKSRNHEGGKLLWRGFPRSPYAGHQQQGRYWRCIVAIRNCRVVTVSQHHGGDNSNAVCSAPQAVFWTELQRLGFTILSWASWCLLAN